VFEVFRFEDGFLRLLELVGQLSDLKLEGLVSGLERLHMKRLVELVGID
jgi:hypothetical protein